jgi:hypothetical protein
MSMNNPETMTIEDCNVKTMRRLPEEFQPGSLDVICQRGRVAFLHNQHFRKLVEGYVDRYANASSRVDKSMVVSEVMARVREASPDGGFVRLEGDGFYYEVGDAIAREKCGGAFREFLHARYRSTTKSKRVIRQKQQQKQEEQKLVGQVIGAAQVSLASEKIKSRSPEEVKAGDDSRPQPTASSVKVPLGLGDLLKDISKRKEELLSETLKSTVPPSGIPAFVSFQSISNTKSSRTVSTESAFSEFDGVDEFDLRVSEMFSKNDY